MEERGKGRQGQGGHGREEGKERDHPVRQNSERKSANLTTFYKLGVHVPIQPLADLATVYKTVRPILSDRCLTVRSVTVYCGQTVGCIMMPLGIEVGLGPGHSVLVAFGPGDIVLDVDPVPPQKWTQQPPLSQFTEACASI